MKEFIISIIPFAFIAVSVVFFAAARKFGKKSSDTYMSEGMAIGMCLGVSLSALFNSDIAVGTSLGLLIGELMGSFINKSADKAGM